MPSVTTGSYRIGMSEDPANNFDLEPDGAGGLLIKRASTGDIVVEIDANGSIVDKRVWVTLTTAQRAPDQNYTNDTGMEIILVVHGRTTAANGVTYAYLDDVVTAQNVHPGFPANVPLQMVIPPGSTYRYGVSTATVQAIREFRRAA